MSRRIFWPCAAFLAGWVVLSRPWLTGLVTIPYDAKAHFQAQIQFLAQAWHSGDSPFWTPNVFTGSPQIADPQSLIFSPSGSCRAAHARSVIRSGRRLRPGFAARGWLERPSFRAGSRLASCGGIGHGFRILVRRVGGVADPARRSDQELCLLRGHVVVARKAPSQSRLMGTHLHVAWRPG